MCEVAEWYSYTEPTANKPHACCECSAHIEVGEKHFHGKGRWHGDFLTFRQHTTCREACELIRDHFNHDECLGFGGLEAFFADMKWPKHLRKQELAFRAESEHYRRLRSLMARIKRRERAIWPAPYS